MSIETVRAWFGTHAPDVTIIETTQPTATVTQAAEVHGVRPGQICKTLSFKLTDDSAILIVMAGDARLDNKKFKTQFGCKAKMLNAEEVVHFTGHPIGGVCPFGLPVPLTVYADHSLREYDTVLPAAGSANSAVRLTPVRLAELTNAQWLDVTTQPV